MLTCKIIASRPNAKNTGFYVDALINVRGGTAVCSLYSKNPVIPNDVHELELSVFQSKPNIYISNKVDKSVLKSAS